MELRDKLKPYCDALVKGMEAENWYLSLMAAFTLPDICNSLENKRGGDDYAEWFDKYVTEYRLTIYHGADNKVIPLQNGGTSRIRDKSSPIVSVETKQVFLTGVIAYALRCAFLHNGGGEVAKESIVRKNRSSSLGIKKVKFIANSTNLTFYQEGNTVYLNPKVYCYAILQGIDNWISDDNKDNEVVLNKTKKLIIFEDC